MPKSVEPKQAAGVIRLRSRSLGAERVSVSSVVGRWLLMGDIAAFILAFVLGGCTAWFVRNAYLPVQLEDFFLQVTSGQIGMFFGLAALLLLWLDSKAYYRQRLPYWEIIGNILVVAGVGAVITGFVQFAGNNVYSRLWLFLSWSFVAVFLFVSRSLVRACLCRVGQWEIPTLMVGNGRTAQRTINALKTEPQMGYNLVGVLSPESSFTDLEQPGAWRGLLAEKKAGFVLLALEGGDIERFQPQIRALAREQVPFSIVPSWQGLPLSSLSTHNFLMHDVMLMHDSNRLRLPLPCLLKRVFDLLASGCALTILAPVMMVCALMIRRDGGPALFAQDRVGKDGKTFKCWKFRTMLVGADAILEDYLKKNPDSAEEWENFQKLKDDPRITRFGQFMRKTSLDELPQLFNVLCGDMSIVGPRPFMPGQEVYYGDDLMSYTSVRPGITGPWQVAGRNHLTFSERVALEAWYTRNWTLWLDIVIILKTFPAVLKHERAF